MPWYTRFLAGGKGSGTCLREQNITYDLVRIFHDRYACALVFAEVHVPAAGKGVHT